jgi:hypothetical protein
VWTQPFPPAVASNQRCRANFPVESDRSAIRQGPDTEDNAARRATAQTGSLKLHSLFLCFRPCHAGRSLVSDDAQRLCELCSISKDISSLCLAGGSSVLLAGGAYRSPQPSLLASIFQCSNQTASPMLMLLLSLLTLPYLASHRSSTTLIIFPPPRRASIGPLSDDNQHEAPISTPTLHVGHLHPHQFCSIHGCRPVLSPHSCAITSCATRVLHGPRPLSQLACSPCAPSTPLFFSLRRQIIARRPWRVRGSFRCDLMLISPLFFSFVFSLDFTISFTCHWCYWPHWLLLFFMRRSPFFRRTEHEVKFDAALRTKAGGLLLSIVRTSAGLLFET